MKTLKNIILNNKKHFIIGGASLVWWLVTFLTDTRMFTSDALDMNCLPIDTGMVPVMHMLTKLLVLIVQFLLLEFIVYSFKKPTLLIPFLSYLVIYAIGLLLTYPGYFMSDDPIIFAYASRYYPVYWHNYLTSLFYMVGMSLFPASCGPIILSDIGYAFTYAFIFHEAKKHYPGKGPWFTLLLGVLPFTLLGALMCFRPALYAPFFLFFVAFLFFQWKEKAALTWQKGLFICFMTALLSIWRSEGIVLMVFIFFILPCVYSHKAFFRVKRLALFTLCLIGCFLLIKAPQSHGENKYYGSDYLIISTTRPLSVIVHRDQTYEGAEEDLANVSTITEFGYLHNDSLSCSAYNRYNSDHNQGKYTETGASAEAQKAYLKSAFRLIAHNLDLYLGERLQLFLVTNGFFDYDTSMVLDLKPVVSTNFALYEHDRSYGFELIEGNKRLPLTGNDSYALKLFAFGGEAYIPVLIILVALTAICLFRKKWLVFWLCAMMLAREAIIFLTAPASFIQYSYPVMFATVFLLLLMILDTVDMSKQNSIKNRNILNNKTTGYADNEH